MREVDRYLRGLLQLICHHAEKRPCMSGERVMCKASGYLRDARVGLLRDAYGVVATPSDKPIARKPRRR